jgi:hypothetical protein
VHADGIDIGPVQQGLVGVRLIGADALDQFELTKELGRASRLGGKFGGGGRGRLERETFCAFGAQYRSS